MTTNTKKTTTTATAPEPAAEGQAAASIIGPPLRAGQTPEKVRFAHHLRVGGKEVRPGDEAFVSPDYARQLRSSGYLARTRGQA
ncbi:hypothetical protein GTY75_08720 [Streptomyces sp. SID8381]|uniref:hypothetical protein n=1 Tax=unclassified Streptomyces TaxID=2593676 RepID=UPI0003742AF8|nr:MULTISPECIES: hypothetical protein [unclassified Streptomyces]MYX26751.1 hypothetical protein [Streptomyces sp. SID8381]